MRALDHPEPAERAKEFPAGTKQNVEPRLLPQTSLVSLPVWEIQGRVLQELELKVGQGWRWVSGFESLAD